MKSLKPWLAILGGGTVTIVAGIMATGAGSTRIIDALMAGVGVMLVSGVAMTVRARYPQRPLWILLGMLAVAYALHPLIYSTNDLLYTIGRTVRPCAEALLVWVVLTFPTGRITDRREGMLIGAAIAAIALLWLPSVMLTPHVPRFGPLPSCTDVCQDNLLFIADHPTWSNLLLNAFRIVNTGILIATSLYLLQRLRQASTLMRRSLAPVLLASVARTLCMAFFLTTGTGLLLLTFTFWAVPLAIALGLLRSRLYTAQALHRLVTGLRRRPNLQGLKTMMANALDDPSLELGIWEPNTGRWINSSQQVVPLPEPSAKEQAVRVLHDLNDQPSAILIHNRALLEEPMLLEAVVSSIHNAIVNWQFESALAGAHAHSETVAEEERRRLEQDLHDGAQQRLLALRMKISVTRRLVDSDPSRADALLVEMATDIDAAITELRTLAHGLTPPLLAERGLAAALGEAANNAGLPVVTDFQAPRRESPLAERAIYFCCVEALQNAAKHAGAGATAKVTLRQERDGISFAVVGSGCSNRHPVNLNEGQGIASMRSRMLAIGGELEISISSTGGLSVVGRIPCAKDNVQGMAKNSALQLLPKHHKRASNMS